MTLTWLHVSDFHFKGGDSYDRDVVLNALVDSVAWHIKEKGLQPDLIFATGDIASTGTRPEYEAVNGFLDALLKAAGIGKERLFVVPGNHDVNRSLGLGLARTLASETDSVGYFKPGHPKPHLTSKQGAFLEWYNRYFQGVRAHPTDSTCGPVESLRVGDHGIVVLPLNSALFCKGDDDHGKLWIGRRCLDDATQTLIQKTEALKAQGVARVLRIALLHHPLEWLHDEEANAIEAALLDSIDVLLHGHLHKNKAFQGGDGTSTFLRLGAGASYQTRQWPNTALYGRLEGNGVEVFPLRYTDDSRPTWRHDPGLFPHSASGTRIFTLWEEERPTPPDPPSSPPPNPAPSTERRGSTIPSRGTLPFVGREALLKTLSERLNAPHTQTVVILHGPPGVGKSELAREYGRRHGDRYPGGTFFLDAATPDALALDLVRQARDGASLSAPADLPIKDQAHFILPRLTDRPVLLIYDNAPDEDSVRPWLPGSRNPAHILITSTFERWNFLGEAIDVPPLTEADAVSLVREIAGEEVANQFGTPLARQAEGLPVQIVPVAASLKADQQRGRLGRAERDGICDPARLSFQGVYDKLDPDARLLLHVASQFFDPQHLPENDLRQGLVTACQWSDATFRDALGATFDRHLIQPGERALRMHQLFAAFLRDSVAAAPFQEPLSALAPAFARQLLAIGKGIANNPNQPDRVALLMAYRPTCDRWATPEHDLSARKGKIIGNALIESGRFVEAQPWFERAVKEG
ncbi:metallophosphoesterase, partial [Pararhodospirillum oryzae]|uniref:metallophosphoesterase n=1 Tax=Pararhodospirillum oryzae TaxID=478448 RepID=UPI0014785B59